MNSKTALTTDVIRLELINGILKGTFLPTIIDLDAARQIVEDRLSYAEGRSYPVLVESKYVKSVTSEARDFFITDHSVQGINASAIVGESLYLNCLANFFMHFSNKRTPFVTKFFNKETNAVKWLAAYKTVQTMQQRSV